MSALELMQNFHPIREIINQCIAVCSLHVAMLQIGLEILAQGNLHVVIVSFEEIHLFLVSVRNKRL